MIKHERMVFVVFVWAALTVCNWYNGMLLPELSALSNGPQIYFARSTNTAYGIPMGRDYAQVPLKGPGVHLVSSTAVTSLFPGGGSQAAQACRRPPAPRNIKVKERVELHDYFPFWAHMAAIGWNLHT
jgi:hypothetical protein